LPFPFDLPEITGVGTSSVILSAEEAVLAFEGLGVLFILYF